MPARTRPVPPSNTHQHAQKIAEAVASAWFGSYGSGRLEVPVSIVATLAAAPGKAQDGLDVTDAMLAWSQDEFRDYARAVWTAIIRSRPELTHLLFPLIAWFFDDTAADMWPHAHTVAQAALRAGQVDLTGGDRRFEVDLLGTVLTVLRPKSALKACGQFYTPADVATLLARMSDVEEQGDITDPMMGTGGMFRAAAETMRESGRDPMTVCWMGCDIDEIAVACATVNSMIWQLGHDIVFYVGDCLAGDWKAAALAQRNELRRIANEIRPYQELLALLLDTSES